MASIADSDRIQGLLLFQHDPVVAVAPRAGPALGRFRQRVGIHVAQGDDVLAGKVGGVVGPFAAGADNAHVQFIVGRLEPGLGSSVAGDSQRTSLQGRSVKELPAIQPALGEFQPS
jgi:hypothetical protein